MNALYAVGGTCGAGGLVSLFVSSPPPDWGLTLTVAMLVVAVVVFLYTLYTTRP